MGNRRTFQNDAELARQQAVIRRLIELTGWGEPPATCRQTPQPPEPAGPANDEDGESKVIPFPGAAR